ncbi:MAG: hypothetical protein HY544_00435 [Candidatus Diapherotrites archaeon]|uniref:Uncharacterized protein n=1 Tax=Candidatus Iainarchaeum sp. TaxID=3101447 RepID=A0A8T3YNZ9_9ARCH|nr:hypothetical protein [Candidatus Diapherotrites archaeon]
MTNEPPISMVDEYRRQVDVARAWLAEGSRAAVARLSAAGWMGHLELGIYGEPATRYYMKDGGVFVDDKSGTREIEPADVRFEGLLPRHLEFVASKLENVLAESGL